MNPQILKEYQSRVTPIVNSLLETHNGEFVWRPTLLGDQSEASRDRALKAFREKQIKMVEGDIGQIMIGSWIGWEDLECFGFTVLFANHADSLNAMRSITRFFCGISFVR